MADQQAALSERQKKQAELAAELNAQLVRDHEEGKHDGRHRSDCATCWASMLAAGGTS